MNTRQLNVLINMVNKQLQLFLLMRILSFEGIMKQDCVTILMYQNR